MKSNMADVNVQLVESIIQVIQSLSPSEQTLLFNKLLGDFSYPSTREMTYLAEQGGSFDFWNNEPEMYTQEDGESIQWS